MSERPETYSAQEAEAEGVRPLSDEELTTVRYTAPLFDPELEWGRPGTVQRLLATLDTARAELERKEAEAATYRRELQAIRAGNWDGLRDTLNEIIDLTLSDTQAGADLLERVRQLEGEVAAMKPVVGAVKGAQYFLVRLSSTDNHLRYYNELLAITKAMEQYEYLHHQGTGAAGEEEGENAK